MRHKFYGALIMLGPDGAGLPNLPDTLPEVRNPLDRLPIYAGTHDELVEAAEQTVDELRQGGYQVSLPNISSIYKPFWARPIWKVIIQADHLAF